MSNHTLVANQTRGLKSSDRNYDFVIVGGGIVGLTVAREIAQRGKYSVAILEKEAQLGLHSSGRNSGVLHAGFYYSSESLKAKLCAKGSRLLFDFAQERGIAVKKTGKVVVATTPESIPQMQVLLDRAAANGIVLEKISLQRLRELEPEAFSLEAALYSPNTAVIDSKGVLNALASDLAKQNVTLLKGSEVLRVDVRGKRLLTRSETIGYGHLVNASGLHADRIAHQMGVGENYCILPFKGVYRKLTPEAAARFKGSIYPVPDLRVPFLGVHVTRNIFDDVYLGPTAIPAFGRENYGVFSGMSPWEAPLIAARLARMVAVNTQGMRNSIIDEMLRYTHSGFLKAAQAVAPGLRSSDLLPTGKVGLRAQLFDKRTAKLEMDFVVEEGPASTHVLNAISPAFSASFAFSGLIADTVLR